MVDIETIKSYSPFLLQKFLSLLTKKNGEKYVRKVKMGDGEMVEKSAEFVK